MQDYQEQASNKARWIRDLRRFLPLKSQFVLYGNVHDYHLLEQAPGVAIPASLATILDNELHAAGYALTILYDQRDGFSPISGSNAKTAEIDHILREIGSNSNNACAPVSSDLFREALNRFVARTGEPVALVVSFASRLLLRNDNLSEAEHRFFSDAFIASHKALPRSCGAEMLPFFNSIFWVVEKESDLPDWLVIDNPKIRSIPIAKPDSAVRRQAASSLLLSMPGAPAVTQDELREAEKAFVDQTEGLLLADMMAVIELGRAENLRLSRIGDAVRRYKIGVTEDPWRKIDHGKIREAEAFILRRVKGQDHAVTHMLDIIKRAITGVGASKRGGRPRGVAFLAGPTGVGKTELAKAITELLFGDERAYIRFDMSEFSAEHADQRLIGAPPGYIGYDAGGELTNAIRERPFSVVLFDEIEKAHPRILDKFLQILDDGVLTSGRGDRVYFSESLILFTSNLGIYKLDETGKPAPNVSPSDALDVLQTTVAGEIDQYFKYVLNRPEILNRLGENIIIFDWIRPEVAVRILDGMIDETLADISEQSINVSIAPSVRDALSELCLADLSNGGRGIRNQVEAHFVNPLSRALFDIAAQPGSSYVIMHLEAGQTTTTATLTQAAG